MHGVQMLTWKIQLVLFQQERRSKPLYISTWTVQHSGTVLPQVYVKSPFLCPTCSRAGVSSPSYGLWPVRNQAAWQDVSGSPASKQNFICSSLSLTLPPDHLPSWCLEKLSPTIQSLVPKWLGTAAPDHLGIPWNAIVNHYIHGIMLIKSNEHKMASLLKVSYVNSRQWQINLWNWRICDSCKIFKDTSDKIQQEIPSKGKVTWLYFASTTTVYDMPLYILEAIYFASRNTETSPVLCAKELHFISVHWKVRNCSSLS